MPRTAMDEAKLSCSASTTLLWELWHRHMSMTWRAFTCFPNTQKVPVPGCGLHFGAGDAGAHPEQGKCMKQKGMDKVHCAKKLSFKLSKSSIQYQQVSGRRIHSRKLHAGIRTTVTRSRFWRWVGGWAMNHGCGPEQRV